MQSYCMADRKCSHYWRGTGHGSLVMTMSGATNGHIDIDASHTIRRPSWPDWRTVHRTSGRPHASCKLICTLLSSVLDSGLRCLHILSHPFPCCPRTAEWNGSHRVPHPTYASRQSACGRHEVLPHNLIQVRSWRDRRIPSAIFLNLDHCR